jgi:2-polyprenyl-6-methoxyphenol hydroxylase-like FAD-dependent oxidoreductase
MTSIPRIVVVGGGPGGLTLARVLQCRGVDAVTVLEQEDGAGARDQGRSLDLHAGSGQDAVRAAGLYDAWAALARPEDQAGRRLAPDGTVLAEEPAEGFANPEIDRGQLRGLLLDALAPGTVRWGTRLRSVEHRPDGTHDLHVDGSDGPAVLTADLVVGADGAWSRVRPLLTDVRPVYTGVTFVELLHTDVDRTRPGVAALAGRGSTMCFVADHGLATQRLSGGNLTVYVSLRVDEDWADGFPADDPDAARAELLGWFADWAPAWRDVVGLAEDTVVARRLHALPVGLRWPTDPGVTLLGDAAHLMSPFGGQGANLAMQDAADLAAAIVDSDDLATATARYEEVMWPRAARAAHGAAVGLATVGTGDEADDPRDAFIAARDSA